jgi:hypothetical protein
MSKVLPVLPAATGEERREAEGREHSKLRGPARRGRGAPTTRLPDSVSEPLAPSRYVLASEPTALAPHVALRPTPLPLEAFASTAPAPRRASVLARQV